MVLLSSWSDEKHLAFPSALRSKNYSSFDAWIFKSPIRKFSCNIMMGVIGCDSYLAYFAQKANFNVSNPCLSIKIKHKHSCGERNDKPKGFCYWDQKGYRGGLIQYSK